MQARHGILTTLRNAVLALSATVTAHRDKSRCALGDIVCEQLGFFDARGRRQRASCMKALRVLEGEGKIVLPCILKEALNGVSW